MNVMAQAHKATKAHFAKYQSTAKMFKYAEVFKDYLKDAHKEYKAMIKQTPEQAYFAHSIEQAEKRVAELQAITETSGFIVVIGTDIRLPIDEIQCKWTTVEKASIFAHVEDARALASRVRNGNGEAGQIVNKADQIKWEISEQQSLIETLKTALKG